MDRIFFGRNTYSTAQIQNNVDDVSIEWVGIRFPSIVWLGNCPLSSIIRILLTVFHSTTRSNFEKLVGLFLKPQKRKLSIRLVEPLLVKF